MHQPNYQPKQNCKRICLFAFLFLLLHPAMYAQQYDVNATPGARNKGMGGTGVTSTNVWSSLHNQAGLASTHQFSIGLYHESRFMMQQLSTNALVLVIPVKNTTFGLSAQYFGFHLYNETKIGVGLGKNLGGGFSGGIQFDYLSRYVIEQYGTINHVVAELGMIYSGFEKFRLGVHVFNPYPIAGESLNSFPLPSTIKAGIEYTIHSGTSIIAEYAHHSTSAGYFKYGAEHTLKDKVALRIGFIPYNSTYSFGVGYHGRRLSIDLAFINHQVLGISPNFSMEYEQP